MKRFHVLAWVFTAAVAMSLFGCVGDLEQPAHSNPLDPENPAGAADEPPKPTALSAVVSDRLVVLSWSVSDEAGIHHYRVYRWEVEQGQSAHYVLLDTAATRVYSDEDVQNGVEYSYRISSVDDSGLEGTLSADVSATPALYGVTINGGSQKTASRNVSLTLSSTPTTVLMKVSNASDLADAQWEPVRTSSSWELPAGDGTKIVFARFRDDADTESEVVSDVIELDTSAVIELLTEDTEGDPMTTGEVIHFGLTTGEPYGVAFVDIGVAATGIDLYDDGTGGDGIAADGVYERDYVIESGVEAVNALLTGHFIDELGNTAAPLVAPGRITILNSPAAVTMNQPVPLSERRLALSWSRSNELAFDSYKLYRSTVPGVDTSPVRELLAELTDAAQMNFTDTGLEPSTTYYYAVYVVDTFGLSTMSNEVAGATPANELPEAVELYPPWAADTTTIEISWSESPDADFKSYELIGWEEDPPSQPDWEGRRLITRITTRDETFYTHESLETDIIYWYKVAVVDSFEARAYSDSLYATPRPPDK